jgi:hypothetical protein
MGNLTVRPAAEQQAIAHLSGEHEISERRARQFCNVIFIPAVKDQFMETLAVAST